MTHQKEANLFEKAPGVIIEALDKLGLKPDRNPLDYPKKRSGDPENIAARKMIHLWLVNELVGEPTSKIPKDTTKNACPKCGGVGSIVHFQYEKVLGTCPICKGAGVIRERMCRFCDGKGKIDGKVCPHCQGVGLFPTPCRCQIKDKNGNILLKGMVELPIITKIKGVSLCKVCKGFGGKTPKVEIKTDKLPLDELLKLM